MAEKVDGLPGTIRRIRRERVDFPTLLAAFYPRQPPPGAAELQIRQEQLEFVYWVAIDTGLPLPDFLSLARLAVSLFGKEYSKNQISRLVHWKFRSLHQGNSQRREHQRLAQTRLEEIKRGNDDEVRRYKDMVSRLQNELKELRESRVSLGKLQLVESQEFGETPSFDRPHEVVQTRSISEFSARRPKRTFELCLALLSAMAGLYFGLR